VAQGGPAERQAERFDRLDRLGDERGTGVTGGSVEAEHVVALTRQARPVVEGCRAGIVERPWFGHGGTSFPPAVSRGCGDGDGSQQGGAPAHEAAPATSPDGGPEFCPIGLFE